MINWLPKCSYCAFRDSTKSPCAPLVGAKGYTVFRRVKDLPGYAWGASLNLKIMVPIADPTSEIFITWCKWFKPRPPATYREYLASPMWKKKRASKLKSADYRCERCGSAINLDVHHLTYAHVYDEPLEDLVVLCRSCHSIIHGKEAAPNE